MYDFEKNFWIKFSDLYHKTKEMYIKAEEYDSDFCSIMQPIKEQRDALDHVIRSYDELLNTEEIIKTQVDINNIKKNYDKAIGHMYRAFYDTADILTIILREQISNYLKDFSYKEICEVWKDYEKNRKELYVINRKIAELRIKKEIKSNKKDQNDIFDEYKRIIDFLFKMLDTVVLDIYPQIAQS